MHRTHVLVAFLMAISLTSACSSYRNVQPKSVDAEALSGLSSGAPVALINAQPSTAIENVGSAGMGRSIEANYNQWTEAAIEVLAKALNKQGIETSATAEKRLSLAVTDAALSGAGGGWAFTCDVGLVATTDETGEQRFVGRRGSWKFIKACDAAVTQAVVELLNDEDMRQFLSK